MTIAVRAVAHTGLTVTDLKASLAFWQGVLGFELVLRSTLRPPHAEAVTGVAGADIEVAILRLGPCSIELLQYLSPPDRHVVQARSCDVGHAHVALVVANLDDAAAEASSHGWLPQAPSHTVQHGPGAGWRAVYLRDGDGTTLELVERTPR
jgi:catechol 2,3-dioxygenase-like lactoylglutathione lyase family enzyme